VTVKNSAAGNERNEAFTGAAVGNRWGYLGRLGSILFNDLFNDRNNTLKSTPI